MDLFDRLEEAWPHIVGAMFAVVLAFLLGFFIAFCLAEKRVKFYYVANEGSTQVSCVYGSWSWEPDVKVMCFPDHQQTIDHANKLNQMLKDAR